MSIKVFAWPPVAPRRWEWTIEDPVQSSSSIITGAEYLSAAQRRRRLATVEVSGLRDGMGAGYMESLKELMRGRINAVRLTSYPINRHLTATHEQWTRKSEPIAWTDGDVALDWTADTTDLLWLYGRMLRGSSGTDSDGWPVLTVSGLKPNVLVARPSEFLTIYATESDTEGTICRVLAPAMSRSDGVAVIRLHSDPGVVSDARVSIGTSETGVFRAVTIPRAIQPAMGDWTYSWAFREIFEDEVGAGGFTEVNPWS